MSRINYNGSTSFSSILRKPYQSFNSYFLSEKSPTSTLADLETNTSISTSIHRLKHHKFTKGEILHYGFLSSVWLFVFIIYPASIVYKLPVLLGLLTILSVPATSQFFLPALPILTWLGFYFTSSKIPHSWKPAISVKVLPAMETILYGDDLSNVLATITNRGLDILAWLPYGLTHFGAPFVVAAIMFFFAPPTSLRSFGFAFGYMNLFGVMIQLMFPAAPPWYKNLYGLQPANYTMHGSPGGLGRIDELLGVDMYTTGFSNSPVIFGAFPSLHSGCCIMEVLFMCWLFPRLKILWVFYASWLWWSTMYLTHHYFVDLTGGAVLSLVVFEFVKFKYLPKANKRCRWSYTELEYYSATNDDPLGGSLATTSRLVRGEGGEGDLENFAYSRVYPSLSQQQLQVGQDRNTQEEGFEMGNISRSRSSQRSLSFLGGQSIGVAEENLEEDDEEDVGSESSKTPSVFDEDPQNFATSQTTSVEDLISNSNALTGGGNGPTEKPRPGING
ncbi:AUR1 [Candida theae]|uniref:AUR1 n=1 Tax=Candida theae TaxID=1198502 RepID=A0AAD5BDU3_9ASCO|nr:AUR1 [Candida theae]KAI5957704.1 AUR1 [Candida theae]